MIYSTKGIVLRSIKYGETSVIATIYTETFGIQSYLMNGVRTQGKTSKASFFQPSAILDLQVYHNDLKNLQRIKEVKWAVLYQNILSDITKNAVALYMVELLYKCIKQPECNIDLFHFCEDAFLQLDACNEEITANFPLYFSLQLPQFFGFQLHDNYSEVNNLFNPREGNFTTEAKVSPGHFDRELSFYISQIFKSMHPSDLVDIKMNRNQRRVLLQNIESYYAWHIAEFGSMKTLTVLHEII